MNALYAALGHWIGPLLIPQVVAWLLALYALGALAFPVVRRLVGDRPAAWAASPLVGLLLWVWLGWWIVLFTLRRIPWSAGLLSALLLVAVSVSAAWRWSKGPARRRWSRPEARAIWIGEALFLAALVFGLHVRMTGGDIIGQEKFMDLAFLKSCIVSASLPPPDPWFYTGSINYYYGGYLLMSALARLTGTAPSVAYNIAVALVFALGVRLVYGLGWALYRRVRWAALAVVAVMLMGNLAPAAAHFRASEGFDFNRYFWSVSRVIVDRPAQGPPGEVITEFPFFSFGVGDLHPHFMALPVVVLLLLLLYRSLFEARTASRSMQNLRWIAFSWSFGWLAFINGFDFLTMSGLLLFTLSCVVAGTPRYREIPRRLLLWAGVMALAVLAFLPFHIAYNPPVQSPAAGLNEFHSRLGPFLQVWGVQLVAAVALVAVCLAMRPYRPRRWRGTMIGLCVASLPALALALCGVPAGTLLALVGGGAAIALWRSRTGSAGAFVLSLISFSCFVLLGCEIVHLRDGYAHALQRMNTVFKFGYPCWVMLGLAIPLAIRTVLHAKMATLWRAILLVIIAVPLLAAAEYPLTVAWHRLRWHEASSLDGSDYLRRDHPGDWAAIEWLRRNAQGGQVVLEAAGEPYAYYARIATNTPLRAVLGWANHEGVWRGQRPTQVESDVRTIFASQRWSEVQPLLERYRVDFVYVGELERATYPAEGLAKFASALPVAYQDGVGRVTIYRVAREGEDSK